MLVRLEERYSDYQQVSGVSVPEIFEQRAGDGVRGRPGDDQRRIDRRPVQLAVKESVLSCPCGSS